MNTSTRGGWVSRAVLVGLGLVAMCAGLALGTVGCHRCVCLEVDPIEPGLFEIVESLERPELVGGVVDVSEESVEISFTDAEGNTWVIDYTVIARAGG
jgi:hypothetical protein